ncbi:tRNA-processing ribonuclease BN [Helicobacter didelphidarum]|uniref:tRNA-processing ribonuclease BN n=2 Tax=Helicobacter didelphidarum TaxID=2040648 RepID=A0A3D8ILC0_9HELI|nr:tRNA-processing ribonuclease BN [Helicobacter didelphidarum]
MSMLKRQYHILQKTYYICYDKIEKCYHNLTDKDKIFHYASSLSFYNIFSIIPLFLMLFSIVSSFPSFQGHIQSFKETILINILPDNSENISIMLDRFLSNGKEMGFLGFLVSLISSFIFFRNFDDISARIFSAKKRSFFDSFIIYWLLITLIPLFFATSIYFNTMISDKYSDILRQLYSTTPMLTTWLAFAILFRIAANKSLNTIVLLISSFLGAGTWYLLKILFFYYMTYNKFYSNIYGSVSIIMFVFLWIYVSWLVVLVSMRICKMLDDKFPDSKES